MKTCVLLVLASLLGSILLPSAHAQRDVWDFNVKGSYIAPWKSRAWDTAVGAEFEAIYWFVDDLGTGFSLGFQQWEVNEDPIRRLIESPNGNVTTRYTARGDATVIPLGVSVVHRGELTENIWGYVTLGVQYLTVDANVDERVEIRAANANDGRPADETVTGTQDIDPSVIGLVAIDFHFPVGNQLDVFFGVGGQFGIFPGDVNVNGVDAERNNEHEALFLRLGAYW